MALVVDFGTFANGGAITGTISDRRVISSETNLSIDDDVEPVAGAGLPDLVFVVGPGVRDENGWASGSIGNYVDAGGAPTAFETGTYDVLLTGDTAEEMVGVIVVEGIDARNLDLIGDGGTQIWTDGTIVYQEAGGIIANR
ncbi:MAG: hypothetical protein GKR98_17455 [Boseongicola sp.]|nr:MAG: hypothetical protein GKR98_17455 [Boseongicola sp.]